MSLRDKEIKAFGRELELIRFYRQNPVIAAEDLLRVKLAVPQQKVLTDMWFKNFVLVTAGRGTGKCAAQGTLIPTEKGLVRIEDLGNELEVLADLELIVQGRDGVNKTFKWYYDGIQPVNVVTTNQGYQIKVTDDHPLLVLTEEGRLDWRPSREIKKDDVVCIQRHYNVQSSQNQLTYKEAELVGLLVGDGCFTGNKYYLSFTSGDEEIRNFYSSVFNDTFGFLPRYIDDGVRCPSFVSTRKSVWTKLESWGLRNQTKSEGKTIPQGVLLSGKKIIASFLRGLFEADGGCERQCVSFTTKSSRLGDDVHQCLLYLGIVAKKRLKTVRYRGQERCYTTITIGGHNIDLFSERIGFISSRKSKELFKLCGLERNTNIDVVPNFTSTWSTMWERTRGLLSHQERERLKRYKYGKEYPSYTSFRRELSRYPLDDSCRDLLENIDRLGYFFDKVASVDQSTDKVYDVVVPGDHSFCANGFVNHNTFLNSVFSCLWAILYPGQKVGLLAPSFRQAKMLFAEVERRWNQAPLLQEATVSKPITASDRCYLLFRSPSFQQGSIIEAVPLGDGCVVSNTYTTLSNGFSTFGDEVKVEDFNKDHQVLNEKSQIWSNGKFRESDEKYYNGIRETLKVVTKKGYSIEGTLNHKLKILRDGEIVWSRLDEMVEGDRILIDRSYRWHEAPEKVDTDSAYVLGVMVGDGCWTNKYKLSFSTKDIELYGALVSEFGEGSISSDNVHFSFHGKDFVASWLDEWGLEPGTYAIDKCLPPKILSASREAMSACISGLYDTDGHVQISNSKGGTGITVGFTNTSEKLVDQLHYILLHYGIVAYKTSRDRDENWNTVYELLITGDDVKKFAEFIGFRLDRKQRLLLDALSDKKRFLSSSDCIPGVLPQMISFREFNRIKKGSGNAETRHIRASCLKERSEASRADVTYFLSAYRDKSSLFLEKLKRLSSSDIYYDEVVEITSTGKNPTYDLHVPDGHEYCASGFFSHNSKIRGARYYAIIADEFAQIPEEIFNTVILPMGATVADPMANVERIARQRALIRSGKAKAGDFQSRQDNKVVMTSSAYYQFNHMYSTKLEYEEAIRRGETQYGVHTISFRDMPEGFLSEENIKNSKARLSSLEFRMEYEAIWEADSAGVFKASLIEKCRRAGEHTVALKGKPGSDYVLGVDPARASDAFALCLIELGNPNKIVAAWEYYQNVFPKMAQTIMDICNNFNVVAIHMDAGAGGGGLAMKDLLAEEERWTAASRILDAGDEDLKDQTGRHILHLFNPSPKTNAEAVYSSLNLMEQGNLVLPRRPQPSGSSEEAFQDLDKREGLFETVESMLRQLMLIEVTQSRSGVAHFDVPSGGGHAAQKKDLFTAFILASKKAYELMLSDEEEGSILEVGIVEQRKDIQPIHQNKLAESMEVSQVPLNSWAFRKTFTPG